MSRTIDPEGAAVAADAMEVGLTFWGELSLATRIELLKTHGVIPADTEVDTETALTALLARLLSEVTR